MWMAFRTKRRTDEALPQTHGRQTIQVQPLRQMFFQVWPLGSAHEATYLRPGEKGETEREREGEDVRVRRGVHHLKIHNRHWVHTRGLAANITTRNIWGSVGKSCLIRHPLDTVRKPFHQRSAMPYQALAWRSDTAKHHCFYFSLILFCTVHHKHGHATSCTKPIRSFIADEQFY